MVPLYKFSFSFVIPVTGKTFLPSIVTVASPSGIDVQYLRLSLASRNALSGLITISIVIGFPGSISPEVLRMLEITEGLNPSTLSLIFPLPCPLPLVYPQAMMYPSCSIFCSISSGTFASVLSRFAGSLNSDTCDMLPFPPVPAPVIRYPFSGLPKNIKHTFSEESIVALSSAPFETGPWDNTSSPPSDFSLVITLYTSAWYIFDVALIVILPASTVSENPLQNRLITITANKKRLPKVCFTGFIISLHSSVRFIGYRVLITLKCLFFI